MNTVHNFADKDSDLKYLAYINRVTRSIGNLPLDPTTYSFEVLNQIHFTKLLKVLFDVQTFGNAASLVMFLLMH